MWRASILLQINSLQARHWSGTVHFAHRTIQFHMQVWWVEAIFRSQVKYRLRTGVFCFWMSSPNLARACSKWCASRWKIKSWPSAAPKDRSLFPRTFNWSPRWIPALVGIMATHKNHVPVRRQAWRNIKSGYQDRCWTASTSTLKCHAWTMKSWAQIEWGSQAKRFGCVYRLREMYKIGVSPAMDQILSVMQICASGRYGNFAGCRMKVRVWCAPRWARCNYPRVLIIAF